jgi:hypothetical protein
MMRDEQHRHLALQLIDSLRKVFGSFLIQPAGGFIKDQYLRAFQ